MGEWLQTCMLTQTPIHGGDPVLLIVLREKPRYRTRSLNFGYDEPTDLWQPVGAPLHGTP